MTLMSLGNTHVHVFCTFIVALKYDVSVLEPSTVTIGILVPQSCAGMP